MPAQAKHLRFRAGLLAVFAVLSLAGCGGGSGGASSSAAANDRDGKLVAWPFFGRIPERTYYLPDEGRDLDPPLREAWSISTNALIEFPPAVARGVAYVVNKYGDVRAVRLRDHAILWRRITDPRLSGPPKFVTSPVYSHGRLFLAFLNGDLIALDAATGKQEWMRNLQAHLESSPLAVGGTLYLGDDKTNLVAIRASDGRMRWQFNSPDAIKASPSYHDGRVFVADYEGVMFCVDAATGKPIWRTNTTRQPPFGQGGFYSSPAISFGHVYAARNDGTVFGFDEKSGRESWSFPTNNFVYGSPAVARVPGTPPSVYIGSYDERLYALNALSGRREWKYDVGGPVPGTATVIGHTVYTSSFKTRQTIGIDARTHKKTFQIRQAGYTPVVSDGRRLYLVSYYSLIGLLPKR